MLSCCIGRASNCRTVSLFLQQPNRWRRAKRQRALIHPLTRRQSQPHGHWLWPCVLLLTSAWRRDDRSTVRARHTYHSVALVGAADSKNKVGTEDIEHVVSFDKHTVVESEVSASQNDVVSFGKHAIVGSEVKTSVMRSGWGGPKWRNRIGKSSGSVQAVGKREASASGSSKRTRDESMGDEGMRKFDGRERSSHMENHEQVSLNVPSVPWIIDSDGQQDDKTHTTTHDTVHTDTPMSSILNVFGISFQHRHRRSRDNMTPPRAPREDKSNLSRGRSIGRPNPTTMQQTTRQFQS